MPGIENHPNMVHRQQEPTEGCPCWRGKQLDILVFGLEKLGCGPTEKRG
jgi:hypothetical protein